MFIDKLIKVGTIVSKKQFDRFYDFSQYPLILDINEFLTRANGLIAFESSLIIRPGTKDEKIVDILSWNEFSLWKTLYKNSHLENYIFFAEDTFGNQFGIYNDGIYFFSLETGEIKFFCHSLEEWAKLIIEDYYLHTGYKIMHEWQKKNGHIPLGYRLCPKIPIILGGDFNSENLQCISIEKCMNFLSSIAIQIQTLPDKTNIKIQIE
jgi:hypothetical protein